MSRPSTAALEWRKLVVNSLLTTVHANGSYTQTFSKTCQSATGSERDIAITSMPAIMYGNLEHSKLSLGSPIRLDKEAAVDNGPSVPMNRSGTTLRNAPSKDNL